MIDGPYDVSMEKLLENIMSLIKPGVAKILSYRKDLVSINYYDKPYYLTDNGFSLISIDNDRCIKHFLCL